MKRILSLLLAAVMLVSAVPTAFAADTQDYTLGTAVEFTAANNESYSITVPAALAPGSSGTVTLEGAWAADTLITVTAQENVKLTNSINATDTKTLEVSFAGISEFGSNTESQKFTESVSVEPISNAIFGSWDGHFYYNVKSEVMDTLEQLQSKHEFKYYSTMSTAVNDVNNGTIGASADVDKENAVAGIYTDENGGVNVVLLQDTIERAKITASADMTINLGGNKITFINTAVGIATSSSLPANLTVDGRLTGSAIHISNVEGKNTKALQLFSGNCNVIGGSYTANANGAGTPETLNACVSVGGTASLNVSGAEILASESGSGTLAGICVNENCSATVSNCDISTISVDGNAIAIQCLGQITITSCDATSSSQNGKSRGLAITQPASATLTNSNINGYSNYLYGDETYYAALSHGILNSGTLTINDCYVMGTHSGLENYGTLYVNGGTYEGYGHGGFYFGGDGSGNTAYVRDAIIRQCAMPDGYTATANCNGAGFYIGGNVEANNITVNMDNCDIYGSSQPIVLRGSDGEQNNSLYISNSTISGATNIRIDNNTHKLYIGTGNNFTAENTTLAEAVVETDETYIYNG